MSTPRTLSKCVHPRHTACTHTYKCSSIIPLSRHCRNQTRQSSSSQTTTKPRRPPKTALFFPGHGVQRHAMLHPWLTAFPQTSTQYLQEVDSIMGYSLSSIIETGTNTTLNQTQHSQPAILATSILVLRVLEADFGFDTRGRVDAALGHSLGEFAALVAAGYLDWRDALRLVKRRAEVMADLSRRARETDPGGGDVGMVALVCSEPERLDSLIQTIQEFVGYGSQGTKADSAADIPDPLKQVIIANVNSKNQIVLSGVLSRIRTLLTNLREFGGHDPRAVVLKADSPFHSPLMQEAADVTKDMLYNMKKRDTGSTSQSSEDVITIPPGPRIPVVSNITAQPFPADSEDLKDLLARQCVETVRWWDSIKYLDQEMQVRRWIGIGPGKVGRNLVGKEVGMKGAVKGGGVWGVTEPREMEEMLKGLEMTEDSGESEDTERAI